VKHPRGKIVKPAGILLPSIKYLSVGELKTHLYLSFKYDLLFSGYFMFQENCFDDHPGSVITRTNQALNFIAMSKVLNII